MLGVAGSIECGERDYGEFCCHAELQDALLFCDAAVFVA